MTDNIKELNITTLPLLQCVKCNHIWTPRVKNIKRCPVCNYPKFQILDGDKKEEKTNEKT